MAEKDKIVVEEMDETEEELIKRRMYDADGRADDA
jgi:hypothetical protein